MEIIKSYKGFNSDFSCLNMHYEVGKKYEIPEYDIAIYYNGFHACESPLDVWDHYFAKIDGPCRFAKVEQSGKIEREDRSTMVCSSRIKILGELKFNDFIQECINWLSRETKDSKSIHNCIMNDNGERGATIYSNMPCGRIGSSGNEVCIASSGDFAHISSSGIYTKICARGYCVRIGSAGDWAKIGVSGKHAMIVSSGNGTKIISSGDFAQISSIGSDTWICSTGKNATICCTGLYSQVMAQLGSWITLADRRSPVPTVKTIQIDGKTYKPDTYYCMENGEIKEVK